MRKVLVVLLSTLVLSLSLAASVFADSYEPNNTMGTAYFADYHTEVMDPFTGEFWYSYTMIDDAYLSSSTDVDWYKFDGTNRDYDFLWCGSPENYDYDCYVYSQSGTLMFSMTSSNMWERVDHSFSGIFYVKVVSKNGLVDLNDSYTLYAGN